VLISDDVKARWRALTLPWKVLCCAVALLVVLVSVNWGWRWASCVYKSRCWKSAVDMVYDRVAVTYDQWSYLPERLGKCLAQTSLWPWFECGAGKGGGDPEQGGYA